MSLLNEMLRNLDRRQQAPGPDGELTVENRVAVRTSRVSVWVITVILAAVFGGGLLVNRYQLFDQGGLTRSNSRMLSDPVAVVASNAGADPGVGSEQASPIDVPEVGIVSPEQPEREVNLTNKTAGQAGTDSANIEPAPSSQQPLEQKWPLPAESILSSEPLPQSLSDNLQQTAAETDPSGKTVGKVAPVSDDARPGAEVILQQPADFYTVQIMAMLEKNKILKYAEQVNLHNPLYAKTHSKGQIWYVLLLGIYADRPSAVTAMDEWTKSRMLSIKPWIRPLGPLQDMIVQEDSLDGREVVARDDLENGHEIEIQKLLREAESALLRERLSSPDEDNAYDRYQAILALVPDHPLALAGIDRIVSTYLKLARKYIASGNLTRAGKLVVRAEAVGGGQRSAIEAIKEQLKGLIGQAHSPELIIADRQSTESNPSGANIRQNTSRQESEKSLLEKVGRLLSRNAREEARAALEEYLVIQPDSIAAIRRLSSLYLQMNELDMARQLLQRSLQLPHHIALELGAQIKVHQGDLNGAISMLESATPGYSATGYYALLAGLYQQTGRFREAANHYRQLLRRAPEHGAYWLGLAVSLDSLKDKGALVAFRRASESQQYHGDVQHYIEQRIGALSTLPGRYE